MPNGNPELSGVHGAWLAGIDSLRSRVGALEEVSAALASSRSVADAAVARARFREARLAYKRVEWLSAYYEPSTSRAMNGPALPRVEEDEGPEAVFPPEGFQVIEELLYGDVDSARADRARHEVRNLQALVTRLRRTAAQQTLTPEHVWDAATLEVARVVSLGVTGLDSPVALHSLAEAIAAFDGMQSALAAFRDRLGSSAARLDRAFARPRELLDTATFDHLDRLAFITEAANPLARELAIARASLGIGLVRDRRAFRPGAATLFEADAFDVLAFAPTGTSAPPRARELLGRALFFEPRLSGDASRSCASCHEPARAFTDGRARSLTRAGHASLRNAPTIINAGLQVGSFYDLRTTWLEDQVTQVVGNPDEMHGNIDVAAATLARDPEWRARFVAAFPHDTAVQGAHLRFAIASYIRSLSRLNAPIDRAFRGATNAISAEARRGLSLFMGRAKCATCHFVPLFNGTVPPTYQESEVEVLGVPTRAATHNARVDPDSGRFRLTRAAPHLHAFKTPSLRNVALTAPYMHNGVYRTLDEVIDFYDRGGGAGIGVQLANQSLPPEPLRLTRDERRALLQFLHALTDTVGTQAR